MWAGAVSRTLQHKPARGTETLSRLAGSLDGTESAMMSLEQPTLGNACYTEHTLSTNSYLQSTSSSLKWGQVSGSQGPL